MTTDITEELRGIEREFVKPAPKTIKRAWTGEHLCFACLKEWGGDHPCKHYVEPKR